MALAAGARCVRPREGQPPSRPRCRRHRRACGRPGSARPPSLHDHAAVPRLPHGGRRLLPLQVQVGVVGVHPLRRVLIAGTHEVARVSQREGVGPVEGEASGLGLGQAMAVVLESTAQHQALAHALWIGRPRSLGRWHLPQQVVSRLGGWGAVVRPRALRNGAVAAYRPWAVHPGPTAVGVPGRAPATRNGGGIAAAISLLTHSIIRLRPGFAHVSLIRGQQTEIEDDVGHWHGWFNSTFEAAAEGSSTRSDRALDTRQSSPPRTLGSARRRDLPAMAEEGPAAGKDLFWEELTPDQRNGVVLLGWDQKTWDEGDPQPMENKFWSGHHQKENEGCRLLTPEEIEAAELLGHDQNTWDHGMDEDEAASKIQGPFRKRLAKKKQEKEQEKAALAAAPAPAPAPSKPRWCGCCGSEKPGEAPVPTPPPSQHKPITHAGTAASCCC
eukprot:SAG25_NODE_4_length_30349_cov_110.018280_29_plen_442_part_00